LYDLADFAKKKNFGLAMNITDKYINILDYSIKKIHRVAAHGLIFKHFPLLMLSGVTANQLMSMGLCFLMTLPMEHLM